MSRGRRAAGRRDRSGACIPATEVMIGRRFWNVRRASLDPETAVDEPFPPGTNAPSWSVRYSLACLKFCGTQFRAPRAPSTS